MQQLTKPTTPMHFLSASVEYSHTSTLPTSRAYGDVIVILTLSTFISYIYNILVIHLDPEYIIILLAKPTQALVKNF